MPALSGSRIGVWGVFDVDDHGLSLYPQVVRRELGSRLADASVRVFAPFGSEHPARLDRGDPAEPLGAWSPKRVAELAGQLDCVLIGGGGVLLGDEELATLYAAEPSEVAQRSPSRFLVEGLGPGLEADVPVVWHGLDASSPLGAVEAARLRLARTGRSHLAVGDELARRRLQEAGIDGEISVVPDPVVLLSRLFSQDVLDRRLEFLRLTGWYPPSGRALVVQGDRRLLSSVSGLTAALGRLVGGDEELAVVLCEMAPHAGDGELADALAASLPGPVYRIPATAAHEDLVAAIAASAGFVGSSRHGHIAALCYGRPHVMVGHGARSDLEGFALLTRGSDRFVDDPAALPAAWAAAVRAAPFTGVLAALQSDVDRHFDHVAEIADASAARRGPQRSHAEMEAVIAGLEGEAAALRRAHERRAERLAAERVVFADQVAGLEADVARALAEGQELRRRLREEAAHRHAAEIELAALRRTRTFRWTESARSLYRRLREIRP